VLNCPDPELITEPKTFPIQRISSLLGRKDPLLFPPVTWRPSPTSEILLSTDACARYGEHICNFSGGGDK